MKTLTTIKGVFTGGKNWLFPKRDIETMYLNRISICNKCEVKNGTGTTAFCDKAKGGCGCSLELKLRVPNENCPKNKWSSIVIEKIETKEINTDYTKTKI